LPVSVGLCSRLSGRYVEDEFLTWCDRCADKKGPFMVETTAWEKDEPKKSGG